jgi:hypothetical protein
MYHGNVKVTAIDADFVTGPDYTVLANAAATFKGLIGDWRNGPTWFRRKSQNHGPSTISTRR